MRALLLAALLSVTALAHAAIDVYEFKTPEEEQRYRELIGELRCPKCQNQNLADSDAGVAKDLKDRTYLLMQQGKSNAQIKAYMIERYGDFITYKPPFRASTWLLWLGPFLLLALVAAILLWRVHKAPQPTPPITEAERQRLAELLKTSDRHE